MFYCCLLLPQHIFESDLIYKSKSNSFINLRIIKLNYIMKHQNHSKHIIATLIFLIFFISMSGFAQHAKYVFYFIGDGMGLAHVAAAQAYLRASENKNETKDISFTRFPVTGLSTTYAGNRFITGSAAAGTALSTGQKTSVNTIGMDAAKEKALETIAERAKAKGFKVGIISSVSLDHATPACFYAHQPERNMYYEISLELPESNFDFFGGGGFINPLGNGDQISAFTYAQDKGYTITNNKQDFYNLKNGDQKVFAIGSVIESSGALRYAIDQTNEDIPLEDFVAKSIELLYNKKGFFVMCEEGKIDWAAHDNDGVTLIKNVISLSKSVEEALNFYYQHPDETLIVVTADHETGGFALGNALTKYSSNFQILDAQGVSAQAFTVIADSLFAEHKNQNPGFAMQLVEDYFGLGGNSGIVLSDYETALLEQAYFVSAGKIELNHDEAYELYGGNHPLASTATHILCNRAGLSFTTWSHTGIPVPVYAIGTGAKMFDGYYDNTDIPKKIAKAMHLEFNN